MTSDALEPTADDRWQRILDQLDEVGRRMRTESATAVASLDDCLHRLQTLRGELFPPLATEELATGDAPAGHGPARTETLATDGPPRPRPG